MVEYSSFVRNCSECASFACVQSAWKCRKWTGRQSNVKSAMSQIIQLYSKTCLKRTLVGPNFTALDRVHFREAHLDWLGMTKIKLKHVIVIDGGITISGLCSTPCLHSCFKQGQYNERSLYCPCFKTISPA